MALGPLGLRHDDLWHITQGELLDLIKAYNYKTFLDRRERVVYASYVSAFTGGGVNSIDELAGKWVDGRVMTLTEANYYEIEKAKKAKRAKGVKKHG